MSFENTTLSPSLQTLSISLTSGPGAPIFEPGPNTRIRRSPIARSIATMSWVGGPREIFGQVANVSPGGCLVKTESTIAPETIIAMTITIIGKGDPATFDVRGLVKHETTADGRRAYGIEFVANTPAERETIQWLQHAATR